MAGDNRLLGETVRVFLRDTLDHCEQIADVVEMYRESAAGLLNTYMSAVAHRSNEVMKVLTIISSIFVSMTFVAGVYGMNLETRLFLVRSLHSSISRSALHRQGDHPGSVRRVAWAPVL